MGYSLIFPLNYGAFFLKYRQELEKWRRIPLSLGSLQLVLALFAQFLIENVTIVG